MGAASASLKKMVTTSNCQVVSTTCKLMASLNCSLNHLQNHRLLKFYQLASKFIRTSKKFKGNIRRQTCRKMCVCVSFGYKETLLHCTRFITSTTGYTPTKTALQRQVETSWWLQWIQPRNLSVNRILRQLKRALFLARRRDMHNTWRGKECEAIGARRILKTESWREKSWTKRTSEI